MTTSCSGLDIDPHDSGFLADAFGLDLSSLGGPVSPLPGFRADRLLAILDRAPCLIAVTRGPQHIVEFANRAFRDMLDGLFILGRPIHLERGPLAGRDFVKRLDDAFAQTPRPPEQALEVQRRGGEVSASLFLDFVIQPVFSPSGLVTGLLIEGHDVTERVLFKRRQILLMDEMNHRVKNTLATVVALIRLARRSATTLDAFTDSLTRRIVAMGQTQELISVGSLDAVSVQDLLTLELAPYLGENGPVQLTCGDVEIASPSAVNLSLIVHELLTNAAKYGALSEAGGRLQIDCQLHPDGAVLAWRETTARPLAPAGPAGFGTALIDRLGRGLGGGVVLTWRADGLDVLIRFAASAGTQASGASE
jgi:two-component sensor histidine kinase